MRHQQNIELHCPGLTHFRPGSPETNLARGLIAVSGAEAVIL
jgi:hypothetical protein